MWVQNKEGKGKVIQPRGYREPINLCYTEYINQTSKQQNSKSMSWKSREGRLSKRREWKSMRLSNMRTEIGPLNSSVTKALL